MATPSPPPISPEILDRAQQRVLAKLPTAAPRVVGATVLAAEAFADLEGNEYDLEYVLVSGGDHTRAYCRRMPPFARRDQFTVYQSHLHPDGLICLGVSAMPFEAALERARFWCNVTTFLFQHGIDATRAAVPEW
jgi:hypothetical protein